MRIVGFTFAVWICFSAVQTYSQPIEISSDEYWKSYTDALVKSRAFRIRHKEITAWYKAGVLTERWTSTSEKDAEGNTRNVSETLKGKKRTITETITANYLKYCRINSGPWKLVSDCDSQGVTGTTDDGETKEKFTKEAVSIGGARFSLLRVYATIGVVDSSGKKTGKIKFNENKVWISDDNLILKREFVTGSLPKLIEYTIVESYDFKTQVPTIQPPLK